MDNFPKIFLTRCLLWAERERERERENVMYNHSAFLLFGLLSIQYVVVFYKIKIMYRVSTVRKIQVPQQYYLLLSTPSSISSYSDDLVCAFHHPTSPFLYIFWIQGEAEEDEGGDVGNHSSLKIRRSSWSFSR